VSPPAFWAFIPRSSANSANLELFPCGGGRFQTLRIVDAHAARVEKWPEASLYIHEVPSTGCVGGATAVEEPLQYWGSYEGSTARLDFSDRDPSPRTCDVPFIVTDPDGNTGQATLTVHVVGNRPPLARLPELRGETTVTLTPQGIIRSPVAMRIPEVWDPDGDHIFVEAPGIPPQYATSLSAFLGSLVALYFEGGAAGDELCRAVREGDVLVDTFTVIPGDACGAATETPAIMQIQVVDKVLPSILIPAQDRTAKCDGCGNTAELSSWLAAKGCALALDNFAVTWAHDYGLTVVCGYPKDLTRGGARCLKW